MRRLQSVRIRRLLTQQQLAAQAGGDLNSVQRWESGSSFPRVQHLARLCRVLNVEPGELVEEDECRGDDLDIAARVVSDGNSRASPGGGPEAAQARQR